MIIVVNIMFCWKYFSLRLFTEMWLLCYIFDIFLKLRHLFIFISKEQLLDLCLKISTFTLKLRYNISDFLIRLVTIYDDIFI